MADSAASPSARLYLLPTPSEREGRRSRARRSPLRGTDASGRRWPVSHKATDWAWTAPVRGVQQHVLLALAERANAKTATCTPSLGELAQRTGLGESTIRGHIRALEVAGLIKVDVTHGGRRSRSKYTLMVGSAFHQSVETPQELGGLARETPQQRAGKKTETPQVLAGIEPETPQLPATNPPAAGGVVLRTNTRTREPGSTGAAAASPTDSEIALFAAPSVPAVVPDERANRIKLAQAITNRYREVVPLSRFPAILGVVRAALDANRYTAEDILAACLRVGQSGRSLTVEALRIELEGFGGNQFAARPSTTDQRTASAQALKNRFAGGAA